MYYGAKKELKLKDKMKDAEFKKLDADKQKTEVYEAV